MRAPRTSWLSLLRPAIHAASALAAGVGSSPNSEVHVYTAEGQHIKAFCDNDGSFVVTGVPKGSHTLQAQLVGFYYPEVCT